MVFVGDYEKFDAERFKEKMSRSCIIKKINLRTHLFVKYLKVPKNMNDSLELLTQTKELIEPCQNMFKEELQLAIKDTITKYKEIAFGADTPVCTECLNEVF